MQSLKVFPVRNKFPQTAHWIEDAKPLEEWPEEWSEFAAPTGKANGFVVVDVDRAKGGLETAERLGLESTANFKSVTPGGGYHLYYKYEDNIVDIGNRVNFVPGVDFRTNGGFVCLYSEVPNIASLNPLPNLLKQLLRAKKPPLPKGFDTGAEVVEGGRNNYLTRAAGRLQRLGVLTEAALLELNQTKCVPPLPEAEVEIIFNSISRYEPESTPEDDGPPKDSIVWANSLVKSFVEWTKNKDQVFGKPTGLAELDKLLGGGKRLGELTVTLAQAKSGKNTLWHYLMVPWLTEGTPIGYASREMAPDTEVLPNLLTLALDKNVYKADDLDVEALETLVSKWKLAFTAGYGPMEEGELFSWMDACREAGIKYFFVDHLHYLLPDSEDYKTAANLVRELKGYAMTHSVHIDLIIQPKVEEAGRRLHLNSMRGGAAYGQALNTLITMERERDDEGNLIDITRVGVEAARSKLAKTGSFYLQYDPVTMKFTVVEKVTDEPTIIIPEERKKIEVFDGTKAAMSIIKRVRQEAVHTRGNAE